MKARKGFTIIEFLLAMTFLATMMIGIAALVIRITNIYQKGLSLRGVNSTGREIISDLTRVINGSRVNVDINPVPTGTEIGLDLIKKTRADYFIETQDSNGRQLGGVFCTGSYSYVWNTAENFRVARESSELVNKHYTETTINNATSVRHVFAIKAKDGYMIPRLARFLDNDRSACNHDDSLKPDKTDPIKKNKYLFDISDSKTLNDITELIEDNEEDLMIYDFTVLPATQHNETKQIFYSGMFILATYKGGVNIKSNGDFCSGSSKENGAYEENSEFTKSNFSYCAINKFNFSARATGETGINKHGE